MYHDAVSLRYLRNLSSSVPQSCAPWSMRAHPSPRAWSELFQGWLDDNETRIISNCFHICHFLRTLFLILRFITRSYWSYVWSVHVVSVVSRGCASVMEPRLSSSAFKMVQIMMGFVPRQVHQPWQIHLYISLYYMNSFVPHRRYQIL